jgi:tripartite-type tricarboxylate transporter receptor subunit TctC
MRDTNTKEETMRIGRRSVLAGTIGGVALAGTVRAADLPDGPTRIVVPAPPGAFNDAFARLIAERLASVIGHPCVVDNKPGAGGSIGTREVMQARPDGRTLGIGNTATLAVNPTVYPNAGDPLKDLTPIALCARIMTVLTVSPDLGVNSVQELIALAKSKPGQLNYGMPGVGSSVHLMFETFKLQTGTDIVAIPYRGSAPVMTAFLAGEVPIIFEGVGTMVPHIQAGKAKPLAVSARERHPALPDVPTMEEAGVPGFEMMIWFGVIAPAGIPAAMRDRLSREIVAITESAEVAAQITRMGGQVWTGDAARFAALIASDKERWAPAVKAANITPG